MHFSREKALPRSQGAEARVEPAKQRPMGASTRGRGERRARFLARHAGSDSPEREEQQPQQRPPGR